MRLAASLLIIATAFVSPAVAAEVTLIPQGLYVERASDGTLACDATSRMRLEMHLESESLQDATTARMERSSAGIIRFDTGAGEFMEVTVEQGVIAFVPGGNRIALQGQHMSGGVVHFNGMILDNGDIDLQSARRLVGESDLTTYVMPQGSPVEGVRGDGSATEPLGYCPGESF